MKKIFAIFFILLTASPIFAANWKSYTYKGWYDESSIISNGTYVTGWFKDLNTGEWELINNKKQWFQMIKFQVDCNNTKYRNTKEQSRKQTIYTKSIKRFEMCKEIK